MAGRKSQIEQQRKLDAEERRRRELDARRYSAGDESFAERLERGFRMGSYDETVEDAE